MKRSFILFALVFVALMNTSCAAGIYLPNNVNVFGAQTSVSLDKANFQVVRDVEAVVEVNNSNLKRTDVEKSAYAELLRNARLTGSQVLTNVVIEEVRRVKYKFFAIFPQYKQYVAARGTVIEFLPENVLPSQTAHITTSSVKQSDEVKPKGSENTLETEESPLITVLPSKTEVSMTATSDESFNPLDYSATDADDLITQLYDECSSKNKMLENGAQYYVDQISKIESIYKALKMKIVSPKLDNIKSRTEKVFGIELK